MGLAEDYMEKGFITKACVTTQLMTDDDVWTVYGFRLKVKVVHQNKYKGCADHFSIKK